MSGLAGSDGWIRKGKLDIEIAKRIRQVSAQLHPCMSSRTYLLHIGWLQEEIDRLTQIITELRGRSAHEHLPEPDGGWMAEEENEKHNADRFAETIGD